MCSCGAMRTDLGLTPAHPLQLGRCMCALLSIQVQTYQGMGCVLILLTDHLVTTYASSVSLSHGCSRSRPGQWAPSLDTHAPLK